MQIPASCPRRLTSLVALAGAVAVLGFACASPEGFHKNRDGGLLTGSGGASVDSGIGTGGEEGDTPGSGGSDVSTGGASASGGAGGPGGASASGGSYFAPGGASGSGGNAGGAAGTVAASGGNTAGVGGSVSSGGASGGGGRGNGGSAGMTGMGGAAGGSSMSCPACILTLTYLPIGTADGTSIAAEVHVATTSPVAINQITIKYWYTNESGATDLATDIDYTGLSTGQGLTGPTTAGTPTTAVNPARTNANTVTSITVPETMTLTPGTQLYVKFRIHAPGYQGKFIMANDYSFGAKQTLMMQWPRITAYVGGVRAWGNEPGL